MGGIETYVRRLYPALLEVRPDLRISVFVNEHGRELLSAEPWAGDVELVTHPTARPAGHAGAHRGAAARPAGGSPRLRRRFTASR